MPCSLTTTGQCTLLALRARKVPKRPRVTGCQGNISMSQNHFTISFPLSSPVPSDVFARILTPFLPDLLRAEDAIGTVHYSRFTVLSEKTMLFLGDFEGEFGELMRGLAGRSGPMFDAIFT